MESFMAMEPSDEEMVNEQKRQVRCEKYLKTNGAQLYLDTLNYYCVTSLKYSPAMLFRFW